MCERVCVCVDVCVREEEGGGEKKKKKKKKEEEEERESEREIQGDLDGI